MKESEFTRLLSKIEFGDSRFINDYYSDIVRAAKDVGAKFEPENEPEQCNVPLPIDSVELERRLPMYKIVRNVDPKELEKEIVNLLCNGWLLAGGVFVLTVVNREFDRDNEYYTYEYIQAVYRP